MKQEFEWISTKDKLPQTGKIIFVAGGLAYYDKLNEVWVSIPALRVIQWEVKWWAELPKPPKEARDEQ